MIARRNDEHKMRQYEEELGEAIRYADSAAQYRIVRKVCNTMKSNRRKLAHMPRICPQKADIENKYKQHPHQGGWMATTISENELDAEEPDFKDVSIFQHEETLYLLDRLAEQYIRSPNRKSYVPGDVPNEAWRILLNDQWLVKGYTPKWGLGYHADEAGREALRHQKKCFPNLCSLESSLYN